MNYGCVWESLSTSYLSLSSHISTFNKNYRCWEELMKYKPLLAYFNKLHREAYKKELKKAYTEA